MNKPVSTALVEHDGEDHVAAPVSVPASDSAAIFSIIERAARDPNVDLDKMERLMAMREREMSRQAEQAFNEAMKAAQAEMRPISADAVNTQTRSKYATYAKLDAALRPIYTKHGFSVSFDEADSPKADHIRVLAYVAHEAGFTRTYRKDMPADGKGAKGGDVMTKTHATGAAASYGQRYLMKNIWNVAVGEDDTDGNAPPENHEKITEDQATTIRSLIEETNSDIEKFCQYLKVEAIPDIRQSQFGRVIAMLEKKRGAK